MLKHIRTVLIIFASALPIIAIAPTREGFDLVKALYTTKKLTSKYTNEVDMEITFKPTRFSPVSIFSANLAEKALGSISETGNHTSPTLAHSSALAQSITFPASKRCDIYASAQTFEQQTGAYAQLKSSIADDQLRWTYVLLHEQAHCLWNAALVAENFLLLEQKTKDIYSSREYYLAQHLGEAYADAYALTVLLQKRPDTSEGLATMLANWRNATTTAKMPHRTIATLALTETSITEQQNEIQNFTQMHAFASKISIAGMYHWLLDQGISHEIAREDVERMQKIIESKYKVLEPK